MFRLQTVSTLRPRETHTRTTVTASTMPIAACEPWSKQRIGLPAASKRPFLGLRNLEASGGDGRWHRKNSGCGSDHLARPTKMSEQGCPSTSPVPDGSQFHNLSPASTMLELPERAGRKKADRMLPFGASLPGLPLRKMVWCCVQVFYCSLDHLPIIAPVRMGLLFYFQLRGEAGGRRTTDLEVSNLFSGD